MNSSQFVTRTPLLLLALLTLQPCQAQTAVFELTLPQAIARAKQNSERLKSAVSDQMAAREQQEFAHAALLPRLALEGTFRYVTVIPTLPASIPGLGNLPFGANENYSIGPTLTYNLWDSGATSNAYQAQIKLTYSREQEQKNIAAQVVAAVKAAYVNVQLGLDQVNLVRDTLALSRAQDQDIANRHRAGSATRLDLLTAHREVLNYELQFKQQQASLASALRDLLALIENPSVDPASEVRDPSRPAALGTPNATVWLKLDLLEALLNSEFQNEPAAFDENSPRIKSQDLLAQSLELASRSQLSGAYPQFNVSARTSLDYPNGPVLQRINQNTFFASLTLPLFEFDRTRHRAAEKEKEAESAQHRRNQLLSDLNRDFQKSKELLRSLREQKRDSQESVRQSEALARLNYESYRFGRINLVDVQGANVRALQAKVDLARINAQILNQLIVLKMLSGMD